MDINFSLLKDKSIKVLGHKNADFDSMTSGVILDYIFKELGYDSEYVIEDGLLDPYFMEIIKKYNIDVHVGSKVAKDDVLFLVDHTADYENEIVGCFDHHPPVVNIKNNFVYLTQTSCAKIVCDFADELGIKVPDNFRLLAVYACYLDSLSFKSTKSVPSDLEWCRQIMKELGMNEEEVTIYGYCLTDLSQPYEDFAYTGLKTYPLNDGSKLKSSYAIIKDDNDLDLHKIIDILSKEIVGDVRAWCFLIHNVAHDTTTTLLIRGNGTNIVHSYDLLSRGKTVIPPTLVALNDNVEYHLQGEFESTYVNH